MAAHVLDLATGETVDWIYTDGWLSTAAKGAIPMPEIIETTVYRLGELSDAKDKARAWYREGGFDYDWYDAVYEDFQHIVEILGLDLKSRSVRLMGGGTRQDPCIWFEASGARGTGPGRRAFLSESRSGRIRDYAPQDTELHRIADAQ